MRSILRLIRLWIVNKLDDFRCRLGFHIWKRSRKGVHRHCLNCGADVINIARRVNPI
jgi:hypothetical protein